MIIGASTGTYFVDTFSTEASSITAMSNCTRFVMGAIAPLIAAPGYSSMGPGGFFTLVSGLILLTSLGLAYVVVFGTQDRVKRKPWSENVEMAAKQLAAVKASRGTGWFSQKMKRTKRADEPPEMAEKVDPANRILKDEAALA